MTDTLRSFSGGVVEPFFPNLCTWIYQRETWICFLGRVLRRCSVFQNLCCYIAIPKPVHCTHIHRTGPCCCWWSSCKPSCTIYTHYSITTDQSQFEVLSTRQGSWNIHHRDVFFDWTSRTRPISIATFSKSHSAAWRFRIIFSLSSVWDPWLSAGPL